MSTRGALAWILCCAACAAPEVSRAPEAPMSPEASGRVEARAPDTAADTSPASASPEGRLVDGRPLAIGETFTLLSRSLGETRRVNLFEPSAYGVRAEGPLPILIVLDGGLDEDFLHVAGLAQVLVSNGGMRPFLLVGIENTVRRRDMTGPTSVASDREIAPVVGGSAAFRAFLEGELLPAVRAHRPTTDELAIVGESLAGLFAIESLFLAPELFDVVIAIDPSLWWNDRELVRRAEERLAARPLGASALFLASSDEPGISEPTAALAGVLARHAGRTAVRYLPLPSETHGTLFHPAALEAFRAVLGPVAPSGD